MLQLNNEQGSYNTNSSKQRCAERCSSKIKAQLQISKEHLKNRIPFQNIQNQPDQPSHTNQNQTAKEIKKIYDIGIAIEIDHLNNKDPLSIGQDSSIQTSNQLEMASHQRLIMQQCMSWRLRQQPRVHVLTTSNDLKKHRAGILDEMRIQNKTNYKPFQYVHSSFTQSKCKHNQQQLCQAPSFLLQHLLYTLQNTNKSFHGLPWLSYEQIQNLFSSQLFLSALYYKHYTFQDHPFYWFALYEFHMQRFFCYISKNIVEGQCAQCLYDKLFSLRQLDNGRGWVMEVNGQHQHLKKVARVLTILIESANSEVKIQIKMGQMEQLQPQIFSTDPKEFDSLQSNVQKYYLDHSVAKFAICKKVTRQNKDSKLFMRGESVRRAQLSKGKQPFRLLKRYFLPGNKMHIKLDNKLQGHVQRNGQELERHKQVRMFRHHVRRSTYQSQSARQTKLVTKQSMGHLPHRINDSDSKQGENVQEQKQNQIISNAQIVQMKQCTKQENIENINPTQMIGQIQGTNEKRSKYSNRKIFKNSLSINYLMDEEKTSKAHQYQSKLKKVKML